MMRSIHWLGALVVLGCGGSHITPFNTDGGMGDDGGMSGDSGCPFCGVDSGGNDGAPACNPNPANYDIPGNNCDDDGDGIIDNVTVCDQGLAANGAAQAFAQAMGICQGADATHWGLVSATYTDGFNRTNAPPDAQ